MPIMFIKYLTKSITENIHICISHWGRVEHIIQTNAEMILLIGRLGTNFSEISIDIHILSFKKIHVKMSSAKWRPFCLGHNVIYIFIICQHWNGEIMWYPSPFGKDPLILRNQNYVLWWPVYLRNQDIYKHGTGHTHPFSVQKATGSHNHITINIKRKQILNNPQYRI